MTWLSDCKSCNQARISEVETSPPLGDSNNYLNNFCNKPSSRGKTHLKFFIVHYIVVIMFTNNLIVYAILIFILFADLFGHFLFVCTESN